MDLSDPAVMLFFLVNLPLWESRYLWTSFRGLVKDEHLMIISPCLHKNMSFEFSLEVTW